MAAFVQAVVTPSAMFYWLCIYLGTRDLRNHEWRDLSSEHEALGSALP